MQPNTESTPTSLLGEDWSMLCFHELFERQVVRTPDAIAVSFQGSHLSYRDLNRRANQVGHSLQSVGIGPEQVVGIVWERATNVDDLLVLLMGVFKAGGAYLYLDPTLPAERLAYMVEDARASLLLVQHNRQQHLPSGDVKVVCYDSLSETIALESTSNTRSAAELSSLAYIIYTSGSTGRPKGVLIPHRGIGNMAQAYRDALNVRPGDRITQFFSFSFDAAIAELATSLLSGATLFPVPAEILRPGPALVAFLQTHAITTATFTPSMLAVLPVQALPSLRVMIIAGEVCPAELVTRWSAPGRLLINAYGPIEATVLAAFAPCVANGHSPAIGRSIPNVHMTIRDEAHLPLPDGEEGELCISGISLARGYTDPTLTAESFIPDPLDPATRLYLTGDCGRRDPDGDILCVGRLAHSTTVKVHGGYRVDLAEIEAMLLSWVAACAVVADEVGQLVACVVLPTSSPPTISELREHLRNKLPRYMQPKAIVVMEDLPRTASDKIDREALRRALPDWRQFAEDGAFQHAHTPLEVQVISIIAETLNSLHMGSSSLQPREINMLKTFEELGGDSLSVANVLLRFATDFHVNMDEDQLYHLSLAHIAARIETLTRESGE